MTDAETDTDREQIPTSRHALAFLSALLDMTADELGRVNTAIRAARDAHLHPGAGAVMAEGIANQEIARMLEQLEQKRRKEHITQYTGLKGKTRQQIIAEAAERREQRAQQLERNRQERAKIRAARQMQREAEKLERKRQREQIRAARKHGDAIHTIGENGKAGTGAHGDAIRKHPRRKKDGENIHIHT